MPLPVKVKKGQQFNRLTCVRFVKFDKSGRKPIYRWECTCGRTKDIRLYAVVKGLTKSCGCLHRDKSRPPTWNARPKNRLVHRIYVWKIPEAIAEDYEPYLLKKTENGSWWKHRKWDVRALNQLNQQQLESLYDKLLEQEYP